VSHGCELKSLIIFLIITRRLEMQSCMLYSPERQEMGMDGNFGSTDLFLKPINIEQGSPGPYKSLKVLKFHTFKYKALKSP